MIFHKDEILGEVFEGILVELTFAISLQLVLF